MPGSKAIVARLPWGVIVAALLVAGIESFVAGRGASFREPGDWGWATTAKAARVSAPGRDVLVFGDSLAKMGVIPAVVEARSGRSTYNLAATAGPAPATYFLLRRALDAGARPRAILVDFFPRIQQLGPRHTPYWPALVTVPEAWELARAAGDPEFFATTVAPMVLPSLRARYGLRMAIQNATGRPWGLEIPAFRRNWRENRGAQLMPEDADPNRDFVAIRRAFYSDTHFDPVNVGYIHRFLDLAAAHAIRVYYLVPPIKPDLQAECERTGFDAAYQTFLDDIQAHHPGVVVVDGRHAGYDPAVFHDANHLGRDGAWAFSAALGDLLRDHPPEDHAGSSLVLNLPTYAGLPTAGAPPEDLDQSRAALAQGGRRGTVR